MITAQQDVTSYLIARTLGVIDATHASTSDRPFRPEQSHEHEDTPDPSYSTAVPTILVSDESSSGTMQDESLPRPDAPREEVVAARAHEDRLRDAAHVAPVARRPSANSTSYFFTPHEEQSMALSGVGVFSPAGTRTSSPVTERTLLFDGSRRMNSLSELGTKSPQSFTLVEQADEDDESETPGLRKRARPPYASSSAEDDSSD
jgi:hypothetical protein